jgi:two-component system, sensor histidine kinase PdtaS
MLRLTIITFLAFISMNMYSQGVSKEEADSLLASLRHNKTTSERMDIFLKVAEYYIFKAGEEEADFDKAKDFMQKASVLNEHIQSPDADAFQTLLSSQILRESKQIEAGKKGTASAVALLNKGKNKFYLGTAYFCLSEYYSWGNPNESGEKRRLVELAVQSFEQTNNKEQLAYCLKLLADLYALNDERGKALEMLDRCLRIYEALHYTALQGVYVLYSNIYYTEGNYKLALNYGLMALKNAQAGADSSMSLCQIDNYIGLTLQRLKESEKAIVYYRDALEVAKRYSDNEAVLQVMANAVESFIDINKPDEALAFMKAIPKKYLQPRLDESYIYEPLSYLVIYYKLRNYSYVRMYCNRLLRLVNVHKPPDKLLHKFYSLLISSYLQSGDYASANMYFSTIDSLTRKIGDPYRLKEDYYLKFRLDTARRNYPSALANLLAYQQINDSLFNETSSRQLKQLEVEYETEKNKSEIKAREQDIVVLNQKNELQKSTLERAKLVRNFTIGGIALLFVIVGLLYRQYRQKQHTNHVITLKNQQLQHFLTEKEWLVKEIHHRVKNNFHVVASLLEIQSSYLKNKAALSAIKESQHRIHSMSIIHQKLYQSETLSTIHMPEYIYELVEYLKDSYAIREKISFDLQIENIELNHAFAITLGLILNEGITNAIKYAFRNKADGKISIALRHISAFQILLSISDDGNGLHQEAHNTLGASMGMELLKGLTDDIGGTLSIENNSGTHIRIIFPYNGNHANGPA